MCARRIARACAARAQCTGVRGSGAVHGAQCTMRYPPANSSPLHPLRDAGAFWLAHASTASRTGFASEILESSVEMAGNDAFANGNAFLSFPMAGKNGFASSRNTGMASYDGFAQHEKRPKAIWLCKTVIARHRGALFGPTICRTVVRCHFGSVSAPAVCKPGVHRYGCHQMTAAEVSTEFQTNRPRALTPEPLACTSKPKLLACNSARTLNLPFER